MDILFGNQVKEFRARIETLQKSVDTALTILDKIAENIEKLEKQVKCTDKKFEACAGGFRQTRDACTLLREELSEASGTIIESTYMRD